MLAPCALAWSDCTAFTNLSPTLITEMLLSAKTACNAWIASVLVNGVSVFKIIFASGNAPRMIVRSTSLAYTSRT